MSKVTDYITLELPDMKVFKSLKADKDPFMKFWDFVVKSLGTEIKGFDVSSVKLSPDDYSVLEKYAKAWYKKQSYFKMLTERKFESSFGMHSLNTAPGEFYKEVPRVKGFVYVESDWKDLQTENLKFMSRRVS